MGLRVRVRGSAAALSCPQRRRPVRPASGWPALAQRSGPARRSHCSERLVLYPPPSGRSYCSSRSVWRRSLAESRQSRPRRTTFLRFAAKGLSRISLPCRSDYVSTFRGDECRSAMSLPCPRRTGFQRFATTTLGARPRLQGRGCGVHYRRSSSGGPSRLVRSPRAGADVVVIRTYCTAVSLV